MSLFLYGTAQYFYCLSRCSTSWKISKTFWLVVSAVYPYPSLWREGFFCIVRRRRLACVMPYSSETQVTKSYTFCLFLLNMLETTTKKMKQQYILRNRIFVIFQVCAEGQYDMMQYMCIIISWKFVKLSNGATKRIPICWCIHRCVTQCVTNSYMVNDNPVTSIACYNFRLDVKISDYLTAMLANSV